MEVSKFAVLLDLLLQNWSKSSLAGGEVSHLGSAALPRGLRRPVSPRDLFRASPDFPGSAALPEALSRGAVT